MLPSLVVKEPSSPSVELSVDTEPQCLTLKLELHSGPNLNFEAVTSYMGCILLLFMMGNFACKKKLSGRKF